jgi:hypothetical protein
MSRAAASHADVFVAEYRMPRKVQEMEGFARETTPTEYTDLVTPMLALLERETDARVLQDVLQWAATRADMPEYADAEDEIAERSSFLIAISPSLRESIQRRSGG